MKYVDSVYLKHGWLFLTQLLYNLLHPLLMAIMKSQRKQRQQELYILNEHPICNGKGVLYVVNHSCRYDFPITSEVIGHRVNVLVGKQRLDLIDRLCFWLNGVVWVDRQSSTHKKTATEKMLKLLLNGESVCMYPEGTWNLEPSKPMLPMYWGCIDLARKARVPIIPLVLEFREKACYTKFGTPIYVGKTDDKAIKFEELKETMATLKWDIWEMFPVVSRVEIDIGEWEREKEARIVAYPKLNYEYEMSVVRGKENTPEYVLGR